MDDPKLHTFVAAITDQVLACPSRPEEDHYPCGWECTGCRQRNAEACAEKTSKVVAAGANRVSSCMEVVRRNPGVAGLIDHTLLKPEATRSDILRVCREARQFGFASVCVNPYWVPTVASELAASCVKVCTVAGFPLGASAVSIKRAEAEEALRGGAQEVDMVINVGALRSGEYEVVDREIRAVTEACHRAGAIVKTILETAFLDDRQKAVACALARMAGADFVKTSTGFGPAGATAEDVALMRLVVGPEMGVKAAGGIRTLEDLRRMVAAGATRIGASASVKIAEAAATSDAAMPSQPKSATRLRERTELLDFFLEIAAVTSETLDLDRLLASVAGIVTKVIPCELFAILLYSERRRLLRIHYSIGHRDELVSKLEIPLGEGITGAAALSREPILAGDVRNDPRYLNAMDAVRTELAVPMLARGGKLVGVIDIESTRPNAYGDYERSTLQLIASRVAAAIDNARLYRRVERQNRTLRTLTRLSQEFSSILDLDTLLSKISGAVRSIILYDSFSILLVDEQPGVLRHRFSSRYDDRSSVDNIALGKGITGAAALSREVVRVDDTLADPRYIPSHPDIRSEVAVPLIVRDRVVGVMDLESERIGHFTEDHVRTLSVLAPQIAISVENARLYRELADRKERMEADLRAARELQSVLLPRQAPEIAGLEIAIGVRPAREISGDLYDFLPQGRDHTLIAMGDVSGKGAAAALYAALVSGLLRTLAQARWEPSRLMKSLNQALLERKADARFVTLLALRWEARKRRLRMANAGGMPPLISRGGEIHKPRVEGVPLGLLEDREYDEVSFQTLPGDLIVLYSDGIEDQHNPAAEHYGRGRLSRLIERLWQEPPQVLVDAIFADLDRFADGALTYDDQTLIVMKVK